MTSLLLSVLLSASAAPISRCAICHPKEVNAYTRTGMGRSMLRPKGQPSGSFTHPVSGTKFTIVSSPSGMRQRIERQGLRAEHEIAYVLGSGNHAFTYLVGVGDYLFQSPLAYYTQSQKWDMAPGFEKQRRPDFDRPVTPECLRCHSGRPLHVRGTLNRYEQPEFAAEAISCEVTLLGNVQAQNPAPTPRSKIGIINVQRAIVETEEGKEAQEKLKADFAPKVKELQAKQAELERLQNQLREQERALSDEARANFVRQIETKTKDFNRSREDFNSEGQQAQSEVLGKIGQKVLKVLGEYALENGYHIVIEIGSPQTPVVWANTAVNLTDDIIKRYNASSGASSATGATTGTSPAKPASTSGTPAARRTP